MSSKKSTKTTIDAKTVRVKKDGTVSATGVKRVVITSTDGPPEKEPLLDKGGENKPVTITRAIRKQTAAITGMRGTFSGKAPQDDEDPEDADAMTVEEAMETMLAEDNDECCYGYWSLIVIGTLAIVSSTTALEYNLLSYVGKSTSATNHRTGRARLIGVPLQPAAPCASESFYTGDDDAEVLTLETSLWDAVYLGSIIGSLFVGPLGDIIGRWRMTVCDPAHSLPNVTKREGYLLSRPVQFLSTVGASVFAISSGLATSYNALWWARFWVGLCEGAAIVSQDLIAE